MENKCNVCLEKFEDFDEIIICNDNVYHLDCVSLYPTGYAVYIDDDFIGESENDSGSLASEYFDDFEE